MQMCTLALMTALIIFPTRNAPLIYLPCHYFFHVSLSAAQIPPGDQSHSITRAPDTLKDASIKFISIRYTYSQHISITSAATTQSSRVRPRFSTPPVRYDSILMTNNLIAPPPLSSSLPTPSPLLLPSPRRLLASRP